MAVEMEREREQFRLPSGLKLKKIRQKKLKTKAIEHLYRMLEIPEYCVQ